eukprot:CAMPEP_0197198948 /NCGR_PEP_ID=MMETSP1423-20130617/33634_1 /TAXON_ID=476441 /ORGANISM="Pseudo-nitzschia heimii, Strain UNC1101" /LENGTH=97 /DNA_ID=CAMNT_0042652795 /DNA_START=39 /DNA_END=332 /DNA_ORIENTATION=+
MATINTSNLPNSSLTNQEHQDAVQLARTLRRIKRRLLLEQCGISLPYALQSSPQVLLRPERRDSTDSTIGARMIKYQTSMERRPVESEAPPTTQSTE